MIEREGMSLNVHTRFSAYHKEGATCTEDCRRVTASCDTPALEPGTYTIKHGERTQKLKIPNELKSPCLTFKTK